MKHPILILTLVVILTSCIRDNDPVIATRPLLKSQTYYLLSQQGEFRPGELVEYFYSTQRKLIREEQSEYDTFTKTYLAFSVVSYFYEQNSLVRTEKTINGTNKKIITRYEYTGGKISRIIVEDEINTQADITYLSGGRVQVIYTNSNGTSFIYRFTVEDNNISFEQTLTSDEAVSSEIVHKYDNHKNPFSLLGYTDLFFNNFSVNNKIKTESQYYSEAFPQLIPVSYEYQYNDLNYPIEQITVYKSTGTSGLTGRGKIIFEYQ